LQRNFRAADSVFRIGGDEFLVLMPETDLKEADVAVLRFQSFLRNWNNSRDSKSMEEVSMSCGVSQYEPGIGADELIRRADALMYLHKPKKLETPMTR
jgi:diguanylate cyclase (GGDEF)-like protein